MKHDGIPDGIKNSIAFNRDSEVQRAKREKMELLAQLGKAETEFERAHIQENIDLCDKIIAGYSQNA